MTRVSMWGLIGLAVLVAQGCSAGSSSGTGGSGGAGAGGGTGGGTGGGMPVQGPFLIRRDVSSGSAALVRGPNKVHLLAAPGAIGSPGGVFATYGECATGCDQASGWTFISLLEGPLAGDVALAVSADATVHAAMLFGGNVTFGVCSAGCLTASNWQLETVGPPATQTFRALGRGRPFAVSAQGQRRLLVSGTSGGGDALLLVGKDGAGWNSDVMFDGKHDAATLAGRGDTQVAALAIPLSGSGYDYAECTNGCGAIAAWTRKPALLTGTGYALGLAADETAGLHAALLANNQLRYARCPGSCTTPSSWTITDLGADSSALGGLDLGIAAGGALAIIGSTVFSDTQTVAVRTCASGCTAATAWGSAAIVQPKDVTDPFPTKSPIACDATNTLRVWNVGAGPKVVRQGAGWLTAYDATEQARCLSTTTGTFVSGDRFVRVHGFP